MNLNSMEGSEGEGAVQIIKAHPEPCWAEMEATDHHPGDHGQSLWLDTCQDSDLF